MVLVGQGELPLVSSQESTRKLWVKDGVNRALVDVSIGC